MRLVPIWCKLWTEKQNRTRLRLCRGIDCYNIFVSPCIKCTWDLSEEAFIGVYDECERWLNPLIRQCWNIQYTMVRRTLKQVPTYDDGVLGYVKEQQVFPLVAHVIRNFQQGI